MRDILSKGKESVILLPTHKSYLDAILISYIHYFYQVQMPFSIINEQLAHIAFLSYFFKRSGALFLNSTYKNDKLLETVLAAYIFALLDQN